MNKVYAVDYINEVGQKSTSYIWHCASVKHVRKVLAENPMYSRLKIKSIRLYGPVEEATHV